MRPFPWIAVVAKTVVKPAIPRLLLVLLFSFLALAQTISPVPQIANPLVPTAVVPGSPAFTLTVNGTGFVSGSTVYWNGSPRNTTYVSAAQMTVAINASDVATATSGLVTVHNPAGAISNTALLLVTNPASTLAFGSAQINSYSGDVLAADFNGDGNPDLLVNMRSSAAVVIGNGDGSFQSPVLYNYSGNSQSNGGGTLLADFNGDGLPDVGAPTFNPLELQILLDNQDGILQSEQPLNLSTDTAFYDSTATGDLNGDGILDVVFSANGSVGIAFGNGNGTFQSPVYIPLPQNSTSVAVADFNRDGIPDIAAALDNYAGISIFLGNGDGTFQSPVNYNSGIAVAYLTAADLNGDGYPDLIGSDINSNSFYVMLNAGNGTFLPSVNYHGPQGDVEFGGIAVGDMNADGTPDIVLQAATFCSNNCIEIYFGNGDGTLQPATLYGIRQDIGGGQEGEISLADFNHDGKLDVGTPTPGGPYLMVQTPGPAPTLDPGVLSFAPQLVGSQSPAQSITFLQPGSTAITINSITPSGDFQTDGGCVGYVLNPGNTRCTLNVYFAPMAAGPRTGSLTIQSSGGTQYVSLSGTGVTGLSVSVSPAALSFPMQALNTMSSYQNVNITNTGSGFVNFVNIGVVGSDAADFPIINLCGSTLAAGANCIVEVAFRPTGTGTRAASLSISDNATGSPQTVPVSGAGTALHISNEVLDFGNIAVGSSSSLILTLRNLGSRSISVSQIAFVGGNGRYYSQVNDCASGIAPRGSCTITVTFTPGTKGQLNALLSFTTNGTGSESASTVFLRGGGR
jgi:archaellum component FlaF (FlaF/FlaG flagellin family)